jgi:hypothetical protein
MLGDGTWIADWRFVAMECLHARACSRLRIDIDLLKSKNLAKGFVS